jgi:hypothetical protein
MFATLGAVVSSDASMAACMAVIVVTRLRLKDRVVLTARAFPAPITVR